MQHCRSVQDGNRQHATDSMQQTTCNGQRAADNVQPTTDNMRRTTCTRDNPDLVFGNLNLPYTTVFLGSDNGIEVIKKRLRDRQPTFFYLWCACSFRPEIRTLNSGIPYP